MSLISPPSAQIQIWREKVNNGTITTEELREAVKFIREGRLTAARAPSKGKKTATHDALAGETAENLLDELGDLSA